MEIIEYYAFLGASQGAHGLYCGEYRVYVRQLERCGKCPHFGKVVCTNTKVQWLNVFLKDPFLTYLP